MIDLVSRGSRRPVQLAAVVVATVAFTVAIPGRRGWFDVGVYHDAVTYWVHAHGHLYDFVRPGTPYGFTYPPFAAVCMLPMAWTGWHTTIAINLLITTVASAFLLHVWVDPLARLRGWNRWFTWGLSACLFVVLDPVRDTFGYGQINLVLVALVYSDLVLLEGRHRRFAGVGTGLAAALKLTPAVFILYFIVTGRWRAAATAAGSLIGATTLAAAVAPHASSTYFGVAMWNTDRVGTLAYVANQSLMGLVARLRKDHPDHMLWIVLVVIVLCAWAWRAGAAASRGNDRVGFALTGLTACLISPVTWVHHLVWVLPGLVVLVTAATDPSVPPTIQRRRWAGAIGSYLVLASGIVWLWWRGNDGFIGFLGSNADVFLALALLLTLPMPPLPRLAPATQRRIGQAALPRRAQPARRVPLARHEPLTDRDAFAAREQRHSGVGRDQRRMVSGHAAAQDHRRAPVVG